MSAQHTPGRLQAGVSKYQGVQSFTAVSEGNERKIVALCGLTGASDELESIANACRLAACWNACEGLDTDKLERIPAPFGQMLNVGFMDLWEQYATAKAQRDELLASVQELIAATKSEGGARIGHIYQPATREHEMREAMAWRRLQAAVTQSGGIPPVVEFKRLEGSAA